MVLRFMDGFDDYTDESLNTMRYNRNWVIPDTNDGIVPEAAAGKFGGVAIKLKDATSSTARQFFWYGGFPTYNITVVAFWFKTAAAQTPSANHAFAALQEFGAEPIPGAQLQSQVSFGVTSTGVVGITKFGQTGDNNFTAGTGSTNICDGNWHHLQFSIRAVSGINGVGIARVDGSDEVSFTGGSMLNISTGYQPLDKFVLYNRSTQDTDYYIDDLLIYDDINATVTGDLDRDVHYPMDDHRIETLRPTAAGTNSDFTPVGATDNYACVDEASMDSYDTYVKSGTTGHTDSYGFGNLSGTVTTVEAVSLNVVGRRSSGGSEQYKAFALSGGTEGTYATKTYASGIPASTYFQLNTMPTDPNTSAAWTEAGINAAEFGIENQ